MIKHEKHKYDNDIYHHFMNPHFLIQFKISFKFDCFAVSENVLWW